jgi:hypothetical protein
VRQRREKRVDPGRERDGRRGPVLHVGPYLALLAEVGAGREGRRHDRALLPGDRLARHVLDARAQDLRTRSFTDAAAARIRARRPSCRRWRRPSRRT